MPVFIPRIADPCDQLVQGEMARVGNPVFGVTESVPLTMLTAALTAAVLGMPVLLAGDQSFMPMLNDGPLPASQSLPHENWIPRANAVIATQAGALVPVMQTRGMLMIDFAQATNQFVISGVTRDAAGAVLPSANVNVYRGVDGGELAAQTISDGAGNYSVPVGGNGPHWAVSYNAARTVRGAALDLTVAG